MKYGVHSYVFIDRWADDNLGILDTVVELGLDCFEIGVGDDVPFSAELTRRRAESLGLELLISPGGVWPVNGLFDLGIIRLVQGNKPASFLNVLIKGQNQVGPYRNVSRISDRTVG